LLHYLQARLPDYMLPSAFVLLTALPLGPTRKVDRLALPPPDAQRLALSSADAPPRSDMERLVAATWQEVLGLDKVGVHDKFFDLGGHSLLAIQVRSKLQARLGREIALIDLFKYPSVAALAAFLSQQQAQHSAVQAITRRSELRKEALHRPKPARRARQETHP
jgi:acyl carrier protein